MDFSLPDIPLELIQDPVLEEAGVELKILREDLIHPTISGNKWRKLKYNLEEARRRKHSALLTFGGAYSNHIAAVAAAGAQFGFSTIGVIRGEELSDLNPTLKQAQKQGMELFFVSRAEYRKKDSEDFVQRLVQRFGDFYLIPEGGANEAGVRGCAEILPQNLDPDFVACSCGTGATLAGLARSLKGRNGKALGFCALKGDQMLDEAVAAMIGPELQNWCVNYDFHFGGYAKLTPELVDFIRQFYQRTGIQLDPIYTGKMLFGIFELVKEGHFSRGTSIVAIHTGGLQGVEGLSERTGITFW